MRLANAIERRTHGLLREDSAQRVEVNLILVAIAPVIARFGMFERGIHHLSGRIHVVAHT
ncbi:hypothetical protein [Natrinema sp. 1APR25-10V2]|uniref:hypothetical protein n=1 Tax=Natrinema sp. 1APR25-10V2 TaxID=2951081 RepID=UPI00287BA237|nr:hypothetical protein [Natrinema sp. 1APR25-10V2]